MRQLLNSANDIKMKRLILAAIMTVVSGLVALDGGSLVASAWHGEVVEKDGVPHILNPVEPASAATPMQLEKTWEAGGDDEDYLFGVLSEFTTDESGNIYVLDSQLNEVLVFSSTGEYLRSIGREGEGPGEFRRPSDMFLTPGGDVAVLQRMPGKIVTMTKDGEPIGTYPMPDYDGMRMFHAGELAGETVVVSQMTMSRSESGMEVTSSLVAVDEDGNKTAVFHEDTQKRDFANMVFDEKTMQGALVWSAGKDGRVYTSDNFDAYTIKVWSPDGEVERVIEREYKSRQRNEEEMERNKPRIMIRRGNQTSQPEAIASETDRDVQQIYPRADGSLWVLSSKGAYDCKDGEIATLDVFDPDGKFMHQVTFKGEGDYVDDGFYVMDDYFFVVTDLNSARRAQFGGGGDEEEMDEEAEPMRILCYELGKTMVSKQ